MSGCDGSGGLRAQHTENSERVRIGYRRRIKAQLLSAAIDFDAGLTYPALSDIPVKRAMIGAAEQVILVADSSKIGARSFSALGAIELAHVLVTDDAIRDEARAAIEAAGVEVLIA